LFTDDYIVKVVSVSVDVFDYNALASTANPTVTFFKGNGDFNTTEDTSFDFVYTAPGGYRISMQPNSVFNASAVATCIIFVSVLFATYLDSSFEG
jgi:hypothetical protein